LREVDAYLPGHIQYGDRSRAELESSGGKADSRQRRRASIGVVRDCRPTRRLRSEAVDDGRLAAVVEPDDQHDGGVFPAHGGEGNRGKLPTHGGGLPPRAPGGFRRVAARPSLAPVAIETTSFDELQNDDSVPGLR